MDSTWPLQVASRELIPVDLDVAWTNKVHLTQQALPGKDAASALLDDLNEGQAAGAEDDKAMDARRAPVWRTRTLCGRPRGPMVIDPALDLLGEQSPPVPGVLAHCGGVVESALTGSRRGRRRRVGGDDRVGDG